METNPLRAERKRRGWSQTKIAEALGVTIRTVSRWELGLTVPYPYYREQLCLLFGKDAKELGLLCDIDEQDMVEQAPLVQLTVPDIPGALSSVNSFVGRERLFLQVKERLLAGNHVTLTAQGGLPGIGKTTLAIALASDREVQAHFRDGILWAGLGPHPNMLSLLARWGKLLGVAPSQVDHVNSRESWDQVLRDAIGTHRLLLVIDDAWTAEDVLALRVGGPACTSLLTTRQSQVASAFAQEGTIVIPQLAEDDGLALLAGFVPQLVQQDTEGARVLVRALDGLPLALTLMGKYLASQPFTEQSRPLRAAVVKFHDTEGRFLMNLPTGAGEDSGSVAESVPLSLHAAIALCDQRLSPQAHTALRALSVFPPKPNSFSEEAALAASQQPVEALDELWDAGLLENWGSERYALHQAIADSIRVQGKVWAAQKQRGDDAYDSWLTNLFGEQESNDRSTTGSASLVKKQEVDRRLARIPLESSVHEHGESGTGKITSSSTRSTEAPGSWMVRTLRGKRKLPGLILLFSMILALTIYPSLPGVITKLHTSSSLTLSTSNDSKAHPGAVANADPYSPFSGKLALNDPLSDNSRGYGWEEFPPKSSGASCQFIGGAYHSIESRAHIYHACHAARQVSNFTLEAQMQIIQGNCGGFALRDTMIQAHAYIFQVCQDGSYTLERLDGFSDGWVPLRSGSSGAIHTGLNQSNVIAAVVNGSTFDLYANHQMITSARDSTYSKGPFGLSASGNTEVAYTNARMWTL